MQDDATVNEAAPDDAAGARSESGSTTDQDAHADAAELREDVKDEIKRAADSESTRHEAQDGPKATPTQREADAATAAGIPSEEAVQALRDRLQAESGGDGEGGQGSAYRTAREIVAAEVQDDQSDAAAGGA